jgi:WD40 repeat protein
MRCLDLDSSLTTGDTVRAIQFHPDGRTLAATIGPVGQANTVLIWDIEDERVRFREYTAANGGLRSYVDPTLSRTLDWMAYHTYDDETETEGVTLTPVGRSRGEATIQDEARFEVRSLAFHPDGRTMLVGVIRESGSEVTRWDVELLSSGGVQAMTIAEDDPLRVNVLPRSMAFTSSGEQVFIGHPGGLTLVDWSQVEPPLRYTTRTAMRESARHITLDPTEQLVAARMGTQIVVWGTADRRLRGITPELGKLGGFAFTPDGRNLAVAGRDGLLTLLSTADYRIVEQYHWSLGPLYSVAFAPDGLTGWLGLDRGRVAIWDRED